MYFWIFLAFLLRTSHMMKLKFGRIYTSLVGTEVPVISKISDSVEGVKLMTTAVNKVEGGGVALKRGTRKLPYHSSEVYSAEEWRNMQKEDTDVGLALKWRETGTRP
jgi:hypothetical protein